MFKLVVLRGGGNNATLYARVAAVFLWLASLLLLLLLLFAVTRGRFSDTEADTTKSSKRGAKRFSFTSTTSTMRVVSEDKDKLLSDKIEVTYLTTLTKVGIRSTQHSDHAALWYILTNFDRIGGQSESRGVVIYIVYGNTDHSK
ncbi:hypothetical protein B566_EDAN001211 [Ephemera danica]|nr:hypothetical protein B566_EDAN001211 [Ephemera danica]